jgi:hypothetical protein
MNRIAAAHPHQALQGRVCPPVELASHKLWFKARKHAQNGASLMARCMLALNDFSLGASMSISALDPVLASALARTRQTAAAPEAALAKTPDTTAAGPDEAVAGTGMTGSTTATVSADTQGAVLSLKDLPSISISEIRKRLFDAYDTDKNGTVDDSEWQNYSDIAQKAGLGDAKPLDFREYDPNAVSQQQYAFESITVLPYQKPAADGGTGA